MTTSILKMKNATKTTKADKRGQAYKDLAAG